MYAASNPVNWCQLSSWEYGDLPIDFITHPSYRNIGRPLNETSSRSPVVHNGPTSSNSYSSQFGKSWAKASFGCCFVDVRLLSRPAALSAQLWMSTVLVVSCLSARQDGSQRKHGRGWSCLDPGLIYVGDNAPGIIEALIRAYSLCCSHTRLWLSRDGSPFSSHVVPRRGLQRYVPGGR